MYFEIENTPDHIKRARQKKLLRNQSPKQECPRLVIAPFSRPPQVVFDNVPVGDCCERNLELFNPSKQLQQITLGKALPPGLKIHLPGKWLLLEPETCYCLTMAWTPTQPMAIRETIRFTNDNRGRYDVIVILKTIMNIKGKVLQPKGFKISPGKLKKKVSKKSPVAVYKEKTEIIYNASKNKKTDHFKSHKILKQSNKENISNFFDTTETYAFKCPFDSPSNIDLNFNTTEVFSNFKKSNEAEVLQNSYDKFYNNTTNIDTMISQNVLKPSNEQTHDGTACDIFDKLTFTPLKSSQMNINDKLEKGPKIIVSVNSESDFDHTLDIIKTNKENKTHSIITITSAQPSSKWLTINQHDQIENQFLETPTVLGKKHPNTSSPKELNSPNFSINTEFSRISDLSFFPQRFSTERKVIPKVNNDTHELFDDHLNFNSKLNSDTYTKESPNTLMEQNFYQIYMDSKPLKEQHPKMCRQALFKDYQQQRDVFDKYHLSPYEHNNWHNNHRFDLKSPPRSITPPLQSIPEESVHFSDTQVLNQTGQRNTFTINRTFDKHIDSSLSSNKTWSKKAVKPELELWKVPITQPKKSAKQKKSSIGGKASSTTIDGISQNITINQIGNVYSQSFTVDPFLSTTYFYDEENVEKFETEFKRWLNCILTPPADLDSNIEQKMDVGKAWIENRNKDIPAAPTKEQVCSMYHNSHRLASLRRSVRALLFSPEITQVVQKLNAQIEKKLIAIRADRNLHLDVGLQKIIMEIILSYNPLWLRIGLEAIYGLILPLKSNSDIEGLSTFIIQRMFKNPNLKNKHSKSNAPNMLLPAYMEAIKKFTLKKFFMLVFLLDKAKQKKLIPHDPCLFCRNAICKESREVIIRFTRELIAGIGDITKHLRPLGYVVSHKQTYLDEYKYAVHNIALDLRDGVRLTKVMEIILIKNGLLNQLRTPAISRLQKIHNVHVALSALKDTDFNIVGDISANDIADGHREKTLSLLWQIIHVFRAPLFEKAANVIQTWWRQKYAVILEERLEKEKIKQKIQKSTCVIQQWWRRIQYNRLVAYQMQQITSSTITIQKYCRMWLCRTRFIKHKRSVLMIENWYISIKIIREAKETFARLKREREILKRKSVIVLQSYVRRWLCMRQYKSYLRKVVLLQSLVRAILTRKRFLNLKKNTIYIQKIFRGKLLMRSEVNKLSILKKSTITIQSYYKMSKQYKQFNKLKSSVRLIAIRYKALLQMRSDRKQYLILRKYCTIIQALFRGRKTRKEISRQICAIVFVQRKIRAHQLMLKYRQEFLKLKNAAIILQIYMKSYLNMKVLRAKYLLQQKSAILIQTYIRSYLLSRIQRSNYLRLRKSVVIIQRWYRNMLLTRQTRSKFVSLKKATLCLQARYRAHTEMNVCRSNYLKLRNMAIFTQRKFRAQAQMCIFRTEYIKLKSSCITIQNAYRAYLAGRQQRQIYLKQKNAAILIQTWLRNCKKTELVKQDYEQTKKASITIQRIYRAFIIGRKQRQDYIVLKTATVFIQKYFRSFIEMKTVKEQYIKLKTATVIIQRFYRSRLETKQLRNKYLRLKSATIFIEQYYLRFKETRSIRQNYCKLKKAAICLQNHYRNLKIMRNEKEKFTKTKNAVIKIEQRYKALREMRANRQAYLKLHSATVAIQLRYRAQILMKQERIRYTSKLNACIAIQRFYRACKAARTRRQHFLKLKKSAILVQRRFKGLIAMKKQRNTYLNMYAAAKTIQKRYRGRLLMLQHRSKFLRQIESCVIIQRYYKAYMEGKKQRMEYLKKKKSTIKIQIWYRSVVIMRRTAASYQLIRQNVILIQRRFRANKEALNIRRNKAATKIQVWYISVRKRDQCRRDFTVKKISAIKMQSLFRMYILRRKYFAIKRATLTIQQYYRSYKLGACQRSKYRKMKESVTLIQSYVRTYLARKRYLRIQSAVVTVQAAFRLKKERDIVRTCKEKAAICIQQYVRRYLAHSRYKKYRATVIMVQKMWRGKLLTRLMRYEFIYRRNVIVKLQARIRGKLVRKHTEIKKESLQRIKNENKMHWAASKIQSLFRGNRARNIVRDKRVANIRQRWREGALKSTQKSLKEQNDEALQVLQNMYNIEAVIQAFRSFELFTEVLPMMYNNNASTVVRKIYTYMFATNRSISSIELLKSAASILVNLTRYRVTGPKIYARDRILSTLKFMWRFSNSETKLFCILSTYLWLFSKYEDVTKDLTELLHLPENHKMLVNIKNNVERIKRMTSKTRNKFNTPQPTRFVSHTSNQTLNLSMCSSTQAKCSIVFPALEPDYGITRPNKPRYFKDAQQAINCLFRTYKL